MANPAVARTGVQAKQRAAAAAAAGGAGGTDSKDLVPTTAKADLQGGWL